MGRSTGELKKVNCRNWSKSYNSKQHNLLTVFDMAKKGYESILLEKLKVKFYSSSMDDDREYLKSVQY